MGKRNKVFNPVGKVNPKPKPRAPEKHRGGQKKLTSDEILNLARKATHDTVPEV